MIFRVSGMKDQHLRVRLNTGGNGWHSVKGGPINVQRNRTRDELQPSPPFHWRTTAKDIAIAAHGDDGDSQILLRLPRTNITYNVPVNPELPHKVPNLIYYIRQSSLCLPS